MNEIAEKIRMVICANCGKDVEVGERPDETCYWCHKSAIKKEGSMVAQINVKELHPETRAKLGIDNIIKESELPPIPPRPDLKGLKRFAQRKALHDYYEANAPAILADRVSLGDKGTRQRWGFSGCGYQKFLERRGLKYESGARSPRSREAAASITLSPSSPPARAETKDRDITGPAQRPEKLEFTPTERCYKCPFFLDAMEYAGYRRAVKDMGGRHAA